MKAIFSILVVCGISMSFCYSQASLPDYLKDNSLEIKNTGEELFKEFVLIPGGTYTNYGEGEEWQGVARRVTLNSFYLQKHEVTNRWYRIFLYDIAKKDVQTALKMLPDTNSWVTDFSYSYNDPMKLLYFKHAAYDDYPVVGVNYYQATAFAQWANEKMQAYLQSKNIKNAPIELRLPMEAEWQYAAAGGLDRYFYGFKPTSENFAGNGVFVLYDTRKNKFRANYKTDEGYYIGDGFFHTGPVGSYSANGYGVYDLIGNVSEWTADVYNPLVKGEENYFRRGDTQEVDTSVVNQDLTQANLYVVKGGSWADDYKKQRINYVRPTAKDSAHCYIGFRLAASVRGNNN